MKRGCSEGFKTPLTGSLIAEKQRDEGLKKEWEIDKTWNAILGDCCILIDALIDEYRLSPICTQQLTMPQIIGPIYTGRRICKLPIIPVWQIYADNM